MNTNKKIGIALAVIMVFSLAAPASASYTGDKPLTVYEQGVISGVIDGGLTYTIGNSYYSGKLLNDHDDDPLTDDADWYNITLDPDVPDGAEIKTARMYIYWTWSGVDDRLPDNLGYNDSGVDAQFYAEFNGESVTLDAAYSDSKGYGSYYNYPSGTYCYDVKDLFSSTDGLIPVNVKNSYPYTGDDLSTPGDDDQYACIQGIGLVVVYSKAPPLNLLVNPIKYWIAEGNDVTYCNYKGSNAWSYKIKPDDTFTPVTFSDVSISPLMKSATLTTVVPAGDSINNTLYFNDGSWSGLWNGNPYADLSWTQTDVTDCLVDGDNTVKFRNGRYDPNGGDRQMNAANAFLVIEYKGRP